MFNNKVPKDINEDDKSVNINITLNAQDMGVVNRNSRLYCFENVPSMIARPIKELSIIEDATEKGGK